MVRTKADSGAKKAVAAKAPRKVLGGGSAASSGPSSSLGSPSASKSNKYGGGNSVCQRPTPDWQKGIDGFFQKGNKENRDLADSMKNKEQELSSTQDSADSDREPEAAAPSSSSSSRKIARISSDEEDDD